MHRDLQTVPSREEHNKTPTPTAKRPAPELGAAVLPPLGGIQLNPPHLGGVLNWIEYIHLHPTDPFGTLGRSLAALGVLLWRSWAISAARTSIFD